MRKIAIIDKIPQSEKSISKKDIVINELIKSKKPMSAEVVSKITKITKLPIQSVRAYLSVYSKMGIITESTCNCCQISKVYRV